MQLQCGGNGAGRFPIPWAGSTAVWWRDAPHPFGLPPALCQTFAVTSFLRFLTRVLVPQYIFWNCKTLCLPEMLLFYKEGVKQTRCYAFAYLKIWQILDLSIKQMKFYENSQWVCSGDSDIADKKIRVWFLRVSSESHYFVFMILMTITRILEGQISATTVVFSLFSVCV